jgi:hypothetical protein
MLFRSIFACGFLPIAVMAAAPFAWIEHPDLGRVDLREGSKPVLTYNFGDQLPAGVDPRYTRSCYVHPIYGLDGEVMTDDFPDDHFHHRGLSWMWPAVQVGDGDRTYDLWHIRGIRQHFDGWLERSAGAEEAILVTRHLWKVGEETVARETMRLVVHRAEAHGRAIDVQLEVEAGEAAIQLRGEPDKGYGAFCLRYAPRLGTVLTTERGALGEDSLQEWYDWTDLSARFENREAFSGIAVFSHPRSDDHGSSWILRHYGFIGTCWPGTRDVTLKPGDSFTLRHRLYLHRGDATGGEVPRAFRAYRESLP